ncbi:ribonuclease H-like domain-containing protein [Tanacetum coccineum]
MIITAGGGRDSGYDVWLLWASECILQDVVSRRFVDVVDIVVMIGRLAEERIGSGLQRAVDSRQVFWGLAGCSGTIRVGVGGGGLGEALDNSYKTLGYWLVGVRVREKVQGWVREGRGRSEGGSGRQAGGSSGVRQGRVGLVVVVWMAGGVLGRIGYGSGVFSDHIGLWGWVGVVVLASGSGYSLGLRECVFNFSDVGVDFNKDSAWIFVSAVLWVLKHNQLIRLMQFLMGLNDVYQNIRSNILARDPLPDVKEAFNVVSREESHRGLHSGSGLVLRTKFNMLLLLIRHTIERCYEIIRYPAGFKRNPNLVKQGGLTIGHPNGTLAKITAVKNIRLSANIVLFDVLIVPEYCVSLLSMHKLIKDSKLFVGFDEHKCYIQDSNLVKTVGTGNECGGLYMFDEDKNGKSVCGMSNSMFVCHVSKDLWHYRLSHPSNQVLFVLSKNSGLKYDIHVSPCDICHKAKQTRDPFPWSANKSVSVGDPVHLDINKKYGIEKHVKYSNLSTMNFCFVTNLNKSYVKASQDKNWVKAMNNEMEALFRNNTWILTDLPVKRKTIRWVQSEGELDVNNAILYGDLHEDVYMDLPPRYYDKSETKVFSNKGFGNSEVFSWDGGFRKQEWPMFVSKKYCLELLCDYGSLACKPATTLMQQNVSLSHEESEKDKKLKSMTGFQKLVGKLKYMSITRPDISYAVYCLSQHMHSPLQSHFNVGLRVLRYLKMSPSAGIQFYHGNNLGKAEYKCMASTTCEVIWLTHLLKDLGVEGLLPVPLYCDSTFAIQIAANPVFHEKTKHFETGADCANMDL